MATNVTATIMPTTIPTSIKGRIVYVIVSERCYGGSDKNEVKVFQNKTEAEHYLEELYQGLDEKDCNEWTQEDYDRNVDRIILPLAVE